jgi:CrcB protein
MLLRIALVALGGGVGSVLRYLVGLALASPSPAWLDLGTLTVNVVGCFAIGAAVSAWPEPSLTRLAVTTGLLGGFTTYSAFNLETWELARHGQLAHAAAYVALTLFLGLAAGAGGAWAGSIFAK